MEWMMFVKRIMWRVEEIKKGGMRDNERYLDELRLLGRMFNDEYLGESWRDGKGNVMLGMCGDMWDWNYKLERIDRFREKVRKELRWFI